MNKNDYLGEYTGELISHREADKRGKIYDRANSSFLFDLNDQASNGLLFIHSNPATISYIADSRFVFLCFLKMVVYFSAYLTVKIVPELQCSFAIETSRNEIIHQLIVFGIFD